MSRQKLMSEPLKQEIARRLGVENIVSREGWGGVSSKDCGRMISEAIAIAEQKSRI